MRYRDLSFPPSLESKKKQQLGNESVLKIMINDAINLFFETAISILAVSNHNSFRVLFDKNAVVYFI